MKFLSIDLEACNKYVRGSVFSIGVVLADDQFNVLYKEDILVNPHCKFNTNFRKPINFSVTPEQVISAPDLREVYPKLLKLFSKDTVVMAHSANNDMVMLNESFKRAKLPPLKFEFICTQMIYSAVYDVMTGIGLDKAVEDLHLTFNHHKADDDAEMALAILKKCCNTMKMPFPELEKVLGIKRGLIHDYTYEPMQCHELDELRKMHKNEGQSHTQEMKKEIKSTKGVSITIEPRSFDMIKQGTSNFAFCLNDKKARKLKVNDFAFLVKPSVNKDIMKVRITKISFYDDLFTLYSSVGKNKLGAKNESELEYLTRVYRTVDETKATAKGVCLLQVIEEK